jgi:hypothetical protein
MINVLTLKSFLNSNLVEASDTLLEICEASVDFPLLVLDNLHLGGGLRVVL